VETHYAGHFRRFGNLGMLKRGDSQAELPLFRFCTEGEQVRNAGTGMAGKLTNRKRAAVEANDSEGVKALNQRALELVEMKAQQVADLLMEATRNGHTMSARLLFGLAGGNLDAEEAEAMKPFRKLLEDLAAEVQLPAEALDETEEARLETGTC